MSKIKFANFRCIGGIFRTSEVPMFRPSMAHSFLCDVEGSGGPVQCTGTGVERAQFVAGMCRHGHLSMKSLLKQQHWIPSLLVGSAGHWFDLEGP